MALPAGAGIEGIVLADQAESLDWRAHRARRIASVPGGVTGEVLAKLGALLGPEGGS